MARMITNFELSENTDFMKDYIAALFLPHTQMRQFPSVRKKLARLPKHNAKQRSTI